MRWPIVLVALLLELVVGVSTQESAAHAAPDGETYKFSIAAVDRPRSTLCLGETVRYTVKVLGSPTIGASPVIEVPGVKVEASVVGVAIGLLVNTLQTARLESLFGLVLIALGLPLYLRLKRSPGAASSIPPG